jgi:hypothetical protein
LTNLHQSLEEFSFQRYAQDDQTEEFYLQTVEALVDVLRQCSRLHKVSFTGDALWAVNPEALLPYGSLFDALDFEQGLGRPLGFGLVISTLLTSCCNLRKLRYEGSMGAQDAQDALVLTSIHQSCPLLEQLDLSCIASNEQDQIAGAGTYAGRDVFTHISRHCKHLRKLTLTLFEVSTSILRSIAGMETLKELTLNGGRGLTDTGVAVLATMRLKCLILLVTTGWTDPPMLSFVGSNISHTLETFVVKLGGHGTPIDDAHIATVLASCHKLKTLRVFNVIGECVFGRSGLDGLQAMAMGCPLLTEAFLSLTVSGIHFLGTHFPNLKWCRVSNNRAGGATEGFPSIEELQTLYPAVKWHPP